MSAELRLAGTLDLGRGSVPLDAAFALLDALARERSVQGAARRLGVSYRSAWGRIAAVEAACGQPVALKTKGHGSVLTPFGEALRAALAETFAATEGVIALARERLDGRLAGLSGLGPKRLRGIREALAGRFRKPVGGPSAEPPPVADVLAVDAAYRDRAGRGLLRQVAPRRFNPTGEAWLPVLQMRKGGRRYRALFSNTATAHRAGRAHDWVVVYYEKDGATGQCTVVTEPTGPLAGKRVIRGRETECARHYQLLPASGTGLFDGVE